MVAEMRRDYRVGGGNSNGMTSSGKSKLFPLYFLNLERGIIVNHNSWKRFSQSSLTDHLEAIVATILDSSKYECD